MVLEIVVPEKHVKNKNVKDLVFSILAEDVSKTLTQIHREIKKKYGISVSFQAVLKAVNSLLEKRVLEKKQKLYSISKDWIFETRTFLDNLYTEHFKVKRPIKKIEMGKDVTVYTLSNLLELDRIWNDLLTNWARKEKRDKRNCWKGRHAWWLIPRLQEEDILHDFMIKHGIKTYNLWLSNTPLDKMAAKYYQRKYEKSKIKKVKTEKDEHITAFGDNVIKFEIPLELSKKLEKIYQKTKRMEDLDVKQAIDLFKKNVEIEFTVIKDKFLANKIKEEVIDYFQKKT